jgi:hypothetical protein
MNETSNAPTKLEVDMNVIYLLGKGLYSQSQAFVIAREMLQNALDAHATIVNVSLVKSDNRTDDNYQTLEMIDNGDGIEDLQKYFLTIGGSSKRQTAGNVGGFGIAKLAIMSADNWSITTISGSIDREGLTNHDPIDTANHTERGTIVTVRIPDKYYNFTNVEELLTHTRTRADITLNDRLIEYVQTENYYLPSGAELIKVIGDTHHCGEILIRVNGLPMYYEYFSGGSIDQSPYMYDIQTRLSAYDEEYPLVANRESLNQTSPEYSTFHDIQTELNNLCMAEAKAQKESTDKLIFQDNYIMGIGVNKKDFKTHAHALKTFIRYCNQIAALMNLPTPRIGLTKKESCAAECFKDKNIIMLNPWNCRDEKAILLEIATHEMTHMTVTSHYEEFTSRQGMITEKIYKGLFNKTFRQ